MSDSKVQVVRYILVFRLHVVCRVDMVAEPHLRKSGRRQVVGTMRTFDLYITFTKTCKLISQILSVVFLSFCQQVARQGTNRGSCRLITSSPSRRFKTLIHCQGYQRAENFSSQPYHFEFNSFIVDRPYQS